MATAVVTPTIGAPDQGLRGWTVRHPLTVFLTRRSPAPIRPRHHRSAGLGSVGYLLPGAIFRPMLGVFLRGTRDSVLLVALLHSVYTRTNHQNGVAAATLDSDALAVIVLTAVTAIVIRHRLSRPYRIALDARPASRPQKEQP
jgi:hypothetical protein